MYFKYPMSNNLIKPRKKILKIGSEIGEYFYWKILAVIFLYQIVTNS